MPAPSPSVAALARFSFTEAELQHANDLLSQQSNWQSWLNGVEAHGLSGFVNQHIADYDLVIPQEVQVALRALKVRHTAAANARFKTLQEIATLFSENGIEWLALKGAALLPHFYKEGYLRPMRDLDLLLPKDQLQHAATLFRDNGFDLPEDHPTKFMRDSHQLPNASKMVDGLLSSVELHHDSFSRDLKGSLLYPQDSGDVQIIRWRDLELPAFEDLIMLHQVSKHLEGTHPGGALKLINVMDVVGFSNKMLEQGRWQELQDRFPHVINTLRVVHSLTPLPQELQEEVKPLPCKAPNNVGETMGALKKAFFPNQTLKARLKPVFLPSDWWLYLYYNHNPNKSLVWIKLVRHPLRVFSWLSRRALSRLLGG